MSMSAPLRFVLRAGAAGTAQAGAGAAAPTLTRAQVLPLRHAPRQLELPLTSAPTAPARQSRLRTG
ncbi:MAG TPA: hypothetical protein VNV16_12320 [Methylibium sp.]|nr:hypothetical protein [Methylibium sp.]